MQARYKVNFIKMSVQFLKDAYYELIKVTWLGKKEVVGTTLIVIVFIIVMSIFISIVDLILSTIMRAIYYNN
ncbi:MAG: preprotein translocase subunit SecE [Endomicrobium sp.]|jgi:preprotein translocase subunit SecE|nr:preprotein translocase subunit SecE [Endomicrobium sp.]